MPSRRATPGRSAVAGPGSARTTSDSPSTTCTLGTARTALTAGVSTIGAVAGNGPSDDFNDQQTTKATYGLDGETPEPEHEGFQPAPWYRSPPLLIAWLVLVLILIALIVYGIGELMAGDEGTSPSPSSSTTTTSTETTSSTTTTPSTTPPASTTTETTPPSSSEAPPTQPTYQPSNPPTTKHHLHLPPGIHLPF
jgi:cell division septation protein DedD